MPNGEQAPERGRLHVAAALAGPGNFTARPLGPRHLAPPHPLDPLSKEISDAEVTFDLGYMLPAKRVGCCRESTCRPESCPRDPEGKGQRKHISRRQGRQNSSWGPQDAADAADAVCCWSRPCGYLATYCTYGVGSRYSGLVLAPPEPGTCVHPPSNPWTGDPDAWDASTLSRLSLFQPPLR